jgi:DNA modification methylase
LKELNFITQRNGTISNNQIIKKSIKSDDLNLDFKSNNTQYATHGIHTYLAAMNPPLANFLVKEYNKERNTVLDPFVGGGAVGVECLLEKCNFTGLDINPLATLISKAKTTFLDHKPLNIARNYILNRFMELINDSNTEIPIFSSKTKINYWFKPETFKPLNALKIAISELKEKSIQNALWVAYSATCRDVSLTYRGEIRLRRLQGKDFKNFNPDVLKAFKKRSKLILERVPKLPKNNSSEIINTSSIELPFDEESFSLAITSPPYGDERNGVPYVQFSKNMLFWLGSTYEEVIDYRKKTLGGNTSKLIKKIPSKSLNNNISKIENYDKEKKEAQAFYWDYYLALKELTRVVTSTIIIVIGNRVLRNEIFENAQITTELLSYLGFSLEKRFFRNLPAKRLPKMRDFGGAIDKEDILIYKRN